MVKVQTVLFFILIVIVILLFGTWLLDAWGVIDMNQK